MTAVGVLIFIGDWYCNSESRKQQGLYRRVARNGGTVYVHKLGVQVTWGYIPPLPSGVEIRVVHPVARGRPDIGTLEALCAIRNLTYVDLGKDFRPPPNGSELVEWLRKRGALAEYDDKGRRRR